MWLLKDYQSRVEGLLQEEKSKKESDNTTEEVILDKLFITKGPNNKYDSKTFIEDSRAI